jgi:hypothetical protein
MSDTNGEPQVEIVPGDAGKNGLQSFTLRYDGRGFAGEINPGYPNQREQFVKSGLQALGLPVRDVQALGNELYQLIQQAGDSKSRLPEIEDACTLCTRDMPLPLELIQGLLHRGSKLQLGGSSKSYTTWTLDALALAVAYGVSWLGFETRQAKVLLVDLELQPVFCRARLTKLQEAMGIVPHPGQLSVWNLRGYAAGHREIFPKIIKRIKGDGFGLVVLDPIYKLYGPGTDENSARDVGDLLNSVEELTVETTAAVAYRAHFSKGNQASKSAIDRVSGSGVFARDPDSLLNFTAHDEGDGFYSVDAVLRNFPPMDPFVVNWSFPLFDRRNDLDPAALKKPGGRPGSHSAESILDDLTDGMTGGEWQKATGIKSNDTFPKLRRELQQAGRVESRNGHWHRA